MYGPYYILLLFMLLVASSLCEQQRLPTDGAAVVPTEPVDWRRTNTMSLEPGEEHEDVRSSGDFSLDTLSEDRVQGSGDGPARSGSEDDEREDEEGSGNEGSGHFPISSLTPCQLAATEATANSARKYIPRCTKKGDFTPHQCDRNMAYCWCVDRLGREIPGSRRAHPAKAHCSNLDRDPYVIDGGKHGGNAEPEEPSAQPPVVPVDGNDFIVETPKDDTKPNADISTINTDNEPGNDLEMKEPISRPSIIGKPGMLAGVICGAVVGLLCAVLLVMFIVYRMRKKTKEATLLMSQTFTVANLHKSIKGP